MNTNQKQTVVRLTRSDKALQLFQAGAVKKIHDNCYFVKSQSNEKIEYEVVPSIGACTCVDFERTGQDCKHVLATKIHRSSEIAAVVMAAKLQALSKIGVVA